MIQFAFSRQSNDELYTLGLRTKEIISPGLIEEMGISLYYNNFSTAFENYATGIKHIGVSARQVSEKDELRDDYSKSLFNHITNYLCYPDEAIQVKVKALLAEIAKHGSNIQKRSYKKETAILETIVSKIEAEFMELMTEIGAMVWFDLLKEAQSDFEKTLREHADQKVEDNKVDSASVVRPDLVAAIRKLYAFLPMQYELTANEDLGKIIELLKVELSRF